ncbi:hypothetical protein DAI22_10g041900 [Oryza sativa Japonica Group]|nr:hypothetical protein DAI22_10g041900 [Oryza sativa Japonica Group]
MVPGLQALLSPPYSDRELLLSIDHGSGIHRSAICCGTAFVHAAAATATLASRRSSEATAPRRTASYDSWPPVLIR